MIERIPSYIINVYKKIATAGYEVYFVGGCVRDLLLNREITDWDLTTNATPEQILQLFPDGFYDNKFGTVGIPLTNVILASEVRPESIQAQDKSDPGQARMTKGILEITTFRTEQNYADNRHPEKVEWGKSLEEDLQRRDFTINAMAVKLIKLVILGRSETTTPESATGSWTSQDDNYKLIDPFNGKKDLEKKLIRAVGDPNERFKEDALRLLRTIRFATQLCFQIEEKTLAAIQTDAALLQNISFERICDELLKILASDYPYDGILLLKNTGLLQYILPELLEGVGVSMVRPGRHHTTDVFDHNLLALKFCPSKDPVVRLATLIHDIAKPKVQGSDKEGLVIFHNHEIIGAKMAGQIADRLRLSKKQKDKLVTLIRWHMFTVDEHITDAAVRRFIRRVGVENVKDIVDVRIGDRLGSGTATAESWRLRDFKKRIEEQLAPEPFSMKDLAIDGNDIIRELNIKPSRQVGEILQKLFEEVDEDLNKNTRDYLLQRTKEFANS